MKAGILSDTHEQIDRVKKVVKILNKEGVNLAIHCGDIVAPFTLQFYKGLNCPIKFAFGNNTGDIYRHFTYAIDFGLHDYEFRPFFSLKLGERKIAVYHGDIEEVTEALIKCGDYDCVFSGHDHIARIEKRGSTLFVNPGSLLDPHKEGMGLPSIAIYDFEDHQAKLILVDEYKI
jgi:putative phosphoesterase